MRKILVALISHQPLLVDGLVGLLAREPDMEVIANSRDASDLASIAEARPAPDVIVLDPGFSTETFQVMRAIGRTEGAPKMLVYAMEANVDYAVKALDTGAAGFLPTTAPGEQVLKAIRTVIEGETFVDSSLATRIIGALRQASARKAAPGPIKLSVREKQIVDQLKLGKTNKEIARVLSISEKTVKHYMTLLMQKVQARNRLEVAMRFNADEASDQASPQMRRRSTDLL